MDERLQLLNWTIRGWVNYFAIGTMKNKMERIDEHLRTMLRKVIWKQWKTPKKRAWGLRKLGIDNDLAKLIFYCGNRYEWVVRRTYVARAISNVILTRRGLVSCLDYLIRLGRNREYHLSPVAAVHQFVLEPPLIRLLLSSYGVFA